MIEFILVIIILGILSVMAVAGFGTVFNKDADGPAQSTLRSLASEEAQYYQTYGSFASSLTTLAGLEPNFSFVANSSVSTGPTVVSVDVGTIGGADAVGIAVLGQSGQCDVINALAPSQSRADITDRFVVSGGSTCSGATALSDVTPSNPW